MDVVLEARPLERAVDLDPAGAEREELTRQPERLAHGRGRIEGAVIRRAILLDPPGHDQPREILGRRQLEKGVVLVVAQDDVVTGAVLPHEVRLEHHRLELVVGDDVLEVPNLPHQRLGLGIARAPLLEVGAHPAPERRRLAHVDDGRLRVLVEVDAGPVRYPCEFLVEGHSRPNDTPRRVALVCRAVRPGSRLRPGRRGGSPDRPADRARGRGVTRRGMRQGGSDERGRSRGRPQTRPARRRQTTAADFACRAAAGRLSGQPARAFGGP